KKDENQVPGRGVDRVAFDCGGNGCIGTRSDAGREGQGTTVFGNDQEECSGGDKRAVGSAMELQAGSGPLVGGAGDGAHRGGRRFSTRPGEGKGHVGPRGGSRSRREEDGRSRAGNGSRPHEQSASTGTVGADKSFWDSGG